MRHHHRFKADIFVNLPIIFSPLKKRVQDIGIADALNEGLAMSGTEIVVNGWPDLLSDLSQGALFVGDHQTGLEDLLLLCALARFGRKDVHLTAKPYSLMSHLLVALGEREEKFVIPMMPRKMAAERKEQLRFDMDSFYRIISKRDLLSETEIRHLNEDALSVSAQRLSEGHAVNIFPTGKIATNAAWQKGVGEIIKRTDTKRRARILIAPYHFSGISPMTLVKGFLQQRCHLQPRPHTIVLTIGRVAPIDQVFSEVDALPITDLVAQLKERYQSDFGTQRQ